MIQYVIPFLLLTACTDATPPPTIQKNAPNPVTAPLKESLFISSSLASEPTPIEKPVIQPLIKYKKICRTNKVKGKNVTKCKNIRIYKKYPGTPVPKK